MCEGRRHSRMWRTGAGLPCVMPSSQATATPPIHTILDSSPDSIQKHLARSKIQ